MLNMEKEKRVFFLIFSVLIFVIAGCMDSGKEPSIYFLKDDGEVLMTDQDLETFKVISLLDGRRGLYIVPKDHHKIEEITTKALGHSLEIHHHDEMIFSTRITRVIKGNNLVFDNMEEETLLRLEKITD